LCRMKHTQDFDYEEFSGWIQAEEYTGLEAR
jgi:hypothetical protein